MLGWVHALNNLHHSEPRKPLTTMAYFVYY